MPLNFGFKAATLGRYRVYVPPPPAYLYGPNACSSLAGWTNSGGSVDGGVGNSAPSYQFASANAHINAAIVAGCTIQFDWMNPNTGNMADVYFGCDSGGHGPAFVIKTSACGFGSTSTFNNSGLVSIAAGSASPTLTTSVWYTIKIVVSSDGLSASWYCNGVLQASGASLGAGIQGGYLGFEVPYAAYFYVDNISVLL